MLDAFWCDFSLAKDNYYDDTLKVLQELINDKDERLLEDIDLLGKLYYGISSGKLKIVEP